jgi:hypothetical protein
MECPKVTLQKVERTGMCVNILTSWGASNSALIGPLLPVLCSDWLSDVIMGADCAATCSTLCRYGKIPNCRLVLYYRPGACTPAVMTSQQWRLGSDLGLVYSPAKNF